MKKGISEAKSEYQKSLEAKAAGIKDLPPSLRGEKKPPKEKDPNQPTQADWYRQKQERLEFQKQQEIRNKKRKQEAEKERKVSELKGKAAGAIKGIQTQQISKDTPEGTAYKKAIGNVASAVGGVAGAAYYGARALAASRKKIEKPTEEPKSKQPELREPGKPGRPSTPKTEPPTPGKGGPLAVREKPGAITTTQRQPVDKRKMLPGSTQGTQRVGQPARTIGQPAPQRPALPMGLNKRKMLPGSTQGTQRVGQPATQPSLGQKARANPALRKSLIKTRMEEYSNWREEFLIEKNLIIEIDDISFKKGKKKRIVDIMRGKNKVEINPKIGNHFGYNEEYNKEIKEERDEEGGMARNELATAERAVKSLRKKIKSPNQQLPAWVQSKITKAADHLDTVADYMMGETEKVTEAYDDETFRQHSRETFSSHTPSESRSRTAGVLKLMKQMNADVEKPKKKKKKKAVAEECGCMDDKKKVLAMALVKKLVDAKKKKNFQLNSEIIGEAKTAAWQRKEGKNPTGGLNKKGIASYRREHPGSHLSLAVTTKPSKLDPDSKAAKRRKSFCARMGGMPGPMKDEKGRPTRKALSLRKWNC